MYPEHPNIQPQPKRHTHSYFAAFAVSGVLALVLLGTTVWLFLGKKDAETNLDAHVQVAVDEAKVVQAEELQAEFAEESKSPYRKVTFAESLGGVTISYPKSWSSYYIDDGSGSTPLEVWMHPAEVPDVSGDTKYGLRIEIVDDTYDDEVESLNKKVTKGLTTAKPVKSNGALGTEFQGELEDKDVNGVMVMFPLRDKTLKMWTDSRAFTSDFANAYESLKFNP